MSFTRLLAAGRSIMGIKKKPGPYRMNQESLLPKFNPLQKTAGTSRPAGSGGAEESAAVPEPASSQPGTAVPASVATPGANRRLGGRKNSVWPRWAAGFALFNRKRNPRAEEPAGRPVQGELSLDSVRVVRNDLSDGESGGGLGRYSGGNRAPMGMVWNRLSARLLRDAARDFTLVQKERGKLLSQAGHGGGGPHGA